MDEHLRELLRDKTAQGLTMFAFGLGGLLTMYLLLTTRLDLADGLCYYELGYGKEKIYGRCSEVLAMKCSATDYQEALFNTSEVLGVGIEPPVVTVYVPKNCPEEKECEECPPPEVCPTCEDCVKARLDLRKAEKILDLKPRGSTVEPYQKGYTDCKKDTLNILAVDGRPKYSEGPSFTWDETKCEPLNTTMFYFRKFRHEGHWAYNFTDDVWDVEKNSSTYTIIRANT